MEVDAPNPRREEIGPGSPGNQPRACAMKKISAIVAPTAATQSAILYERRSVLGTGGVMGMGGRRLLARPAPWAQSW
jgi:hypothetical protein